ncbi:PP2C family protein-serine/threonine phosphatase [Sorangium atrum]|uniref:Serine/threonine-protein phosphatase n=1 Tax=Sorangium atrum TaxID=2995308 RepID=A0ABT5C2T1_9BACT|nr:serine/threonine-protein phosphatase [Sorangium aterium]MDC0680713.1 serine/threonine-protein phosphatase [Sorangium aterium]
MLAIEAGADAPVSRRRASNEERSGELPCLGLFLVTGGCDADAVSRTAIEMVHAVVEADGVDDDRAGEMIAARCRDEVRLMTSPRRSSGNRFESDRREPGPSGAQVNFAGVLLAPGAAYIAYAGNMRICLFREGKLEARTRDLVGVEGDVSEGSVSQDVLATLVQHAHAATRALGCEAAMEMKIQVECTEPGDVLLVCSKDIWGAVPEHRISGILAVHDELRLAASLLMDCAHENGEPQYVTCILARVADI